MNRSCFSLLKPLLAGRPLSGILLIAIATLAAMPAAAQTRPAMWVRGITQPINDVVLGSPLAGILGARLFEEGQFLKQGEILMELDKRIEELEVSRRQLVLDLTKTDLDRLRTLAERSSISVRQEEIDKKIAEFNVAQVEFELAKEQLKKRQVTAPFEGVIAEYFLKVGEACQAQQPLARLVDTRKCYFVANVEANSGYALKAGQTVQLEIEAGSQAAGIPGTVHFVSPVVDPASGLLKVKIVFENPDLRIRPGVAGRMQLPQS